MNTQTSRFIAQKLLSGSILLLIVAYPLGLTLPSWWGFENQPIENLQVALLAAGLVACALFVNGSASAGRWLGLAAAPILLIIIGRELSWGAVFLEPTTVNEHGPRFSSQLLWYKPAVAPIVAGLIVFSGVVVVISGLPLRGIRLLKNRRAPIWSLVTTGLAMLVSTAAEGHVPLLPLNAYLSDDAGQLIEELFELAAYMAMLAGLLFIFADLEEQD